MDINVDINVFFRSHECDSYKIASVLITEVGKNVLVCMQRITMPDVGSRRE